MLSEHGLALQIVAEPILAAARGWPWLSTAQLLEPHRFDLPVAKGLGYVLHVPDADNRQDRLVLRGDGDYPSRHVPVAIVDQYPLDAREFVAQGLEVLTLPVLVPLELPLDRLLGGDQSDECSEEQLELLAEGHRPPEVGEDRCGVQIDQRQLRPDLPRGGGGCQHLGPRLRA